MKIEVEIKSCNDCRHRDHSGSFTKGGAYPICGHSDACWVIRDPKHPKEAYHIGRIGF